MKAFERAEEYTFLFPEDMKIIIKYLEERGTLNINHKLLEDFYFDFSDELFSANWMDPSLDSLDRFSHWLEDKDV